MIIRCMTIAAVALALLGCRLLATETENYALQVLPASGPMTIDGSTADWNLAGGLFACGDVENQRDQFALWAHACYDDSNLYILGRFVDPTPLNNPGQIEGDNGFEGDCLQFRLIIGSGGASDKGRCSHWTCWQGRDGKSVMNVVYGTKFDQGGIKDAQTNGAKQAFAVWSDKHGYNQELSIPWSLIAPAGWKPTVHDTLRLTFEPNFTIGTHGRLSAKDLFSSDIQIDRVFTFMSSQCWGHATLTAPGAIAPSPVHLSDHREFPVSMHDGLPVVDWTGLIKQKTLTGHKPIAFVMPFDGYISLNIFAPDGAVVRQLLNDAFFAKGPHEVLWDGLTTFSWRVPGDPVPAGSYTWKALVHPAFDLTLVGWADNAGSAPWDGPTGRENWGGDHGLPICASALGDQVLLGWSFAEAGKALVACDQSGGVRWKQSRQGMSGCALVASDGAFVFGLNEKQIYRLHGADGSYAVWPGRDSPDLGLQDLLPGEKGLAQSEISALAARNGQLFIAVEKANALFIADGQSGALLKRIPLPAPIALAAGDGTTIYASSAHDGIVAIDTSTAAITPFAAIHDVWGLATDRAGLLYAVVRGEVQQVVILDKSGKQIRAIGRHGGRTAVGPWDASALRNTRGIAVDGKDQVWVAEECATPKRFSVWDAHAGTLIKELFGCPSYGALGGSISPIDPLVMAGQGCEWKIDPHTGKATCLAVIDPDGFQNSRFAIGANGREYLVTCTSWAYDLAPLKIYEHLAPGRWVLRSMVQYQDKDGHPLNLGGGQHAGDGATTRIWADRNGDGRPDPDELSPPVPGILKFSGWYMDVTPDLTMYAGTSQFHCTGFTACGAPTWDLSAPTRMPASGLGSADGRLVLSPGEYAAAHSQFRCFDIASGTLRWSYPDTFVGVHGSHNAPPAEVGLIRGSYGPCSSVKLPAPIGNAWIIATNVGEWHILTEQGFYLTRLFQPDQTRVAFPPQAIPGVLLNDCPCGMGGEDFGGSATLAADGTLYLQAGKTGFWNVAVRHLDQVQAIAGQSPITLTPADLPLALSFREQALQSTVGTRRLTVTRVSPTFTGHIDMDFAGASLITYEKGEGTRVRSAMTWDPSALHVAWEVQDKTPWINGGRSADALYWGGDTVDLQLGTDPAAAADRSDATRGDVRLSIGSLAGKDTVVMFRKVAEVKHPKTFSSGVVKEYAMDSVTVLEHAVILVSKRGDGYTVEATIPASDLGFTPRPGLSLKGDLGVTFGNQSGDRTRLRSYWSNQHTGIVDDVVFELMMEPRFWGELHFE